MECRLMVRRKFLKFIGFGSLVIITILQWSFNFSKTKTSFYVAGVRYLNTPIKTKVGDSVRINKEEFNGVAIMSITHGNSKIGYVPNRLILFLDKVSIINSYLSEVNPYSVPWKRYKVTAEF